MGLAAPKRDYYAQTARGNRLFELGLAPVALALCGSSSPEDQRLIDRCLSEGGPTEFAARFLDAKGLPWASQLIKRWLRPAAHFFMRSAQPWETIEGECYDVSPADFRPLAADWQAMMAAD